MSGVLHWLWLPMIIVWPKYAHRIVHFRDGEIVKEERLLQDDGGGSLEVD